MLADFRRRRAAGSAVRRLPAAAAVVAAMSSACATAPPAPHPGLAPGVGSVARVLAACLGDEPGFCSGFIQSAFDFLYEHRAICPPPLDSSDVEAVVIDALRRASPESPAITVVTSAIHRAWPCADQDPFLEASLAAPSARP